MRHISGKLLQDLPAVVPPLVSRLHPLLLSILLGHPLLLGQEWIIFRGRWIWRWEHHFERMMSEQVIPLPQVCSCRWVLCWAGAPWKSFAGLLCVGQVNTKQWTCEGKRRDTQMWSNKIAIRQAATGIIYRPTTILSEVYDEPSMSIIHLLHSCCCRAEPYDIWSLLDNTHS